MESEEAKAGCDGRQGAEGQGKSKRPVLPRSMRLCDWILRMVAIATTLTSAILMGVAKESKTIHVQLGPSLPTINVMATAKSHYSSAFVYFVVANATACVCSVISLLLSIAKRAPLLISVIDLAVLALLSSGDGAGAAIGVVGQRGISKVGWNKVCDVYTNYCACVSASVIISLVGSLAYVMLLLLTLVGLHKRAA